MALRPLKDESFWTKHHQHLGTSTLGLSYSLGPVHDGVWLAPGCRPFSKQSDHCLPTVTGLPGHRQVRHCLTSQVRRTQLSLPHRFLVQDKTKNDGDR